METFANEEIFEFCLDRKQGVNGLKVLKFHLINFHNWRIRPILDFYENFITEKIEEVGGNSEIH